MSKLIITACSLLVLALVPDRVRGDAIELSLHQVNIVRASGTQSRFATVAVGKQGEITAKNGHFAIAAEAGSVTGAVDLLDGNRMSPTWLFQNLLVHLDDARIRFDSGRIDSNKRLVQGDGAQMTSPRLHVRAAHGHIDLDRQHAHLTTQVVGTVLP